MFAPHWISTHRGNIGNRTDKDVFAAWGPQFFKTITIDSTVPYLEDVPAGALIIVRNYPMSEDGNRGNAAVQIETPADPAAVSLDGMPGVRPINLFGLKEVVAMPEASGEAPQVIGTRHAATCQQMALYCESKGVPRSRLLFEGLNEPTLWAGEPPEWIAAYYRAFLIGLHGYGLRGVAGNFGVGWPGNGGVQDAPVAWDFFKPAIDVFLPGDYLGLHEYWALEGPGQNWRWWAGRFLQCPYRVPFLVTECGIDTGVTGNWYGGWGDLPGTWEQKAQRYVDELIWYAQECAKDGRVKGLFPFTYDIGSAHWEKFNIRNESFLREFLGRKTQWPQPGGITPPPPPPVVPPITPPPATVYEINGRVVQGWPSGITAVEGYVQDEAGAPLNGKIVRVAWAGQGASSEAVSGPHAGYMDWAPGYFSLPLFVNGVTPCAGEWDIWVVDPVHSVTSGIVRFETGGQAGGVNRIEMRFVRRAVTVAPPPPVVGEFGRWALAEAEGEQVLRLNPGAALQKRIYADGFMPTSPEFYREWYDQQLVLQRAERLSDGAVRVYYAREGAWDAVGMVERG